MKTFNFISACILTLTVAGCGTPTDKGTAPALPPAEELNRPFGSADEKRFKTPPKVYHPETWFHFIGGNVAEKGITADLEAIAGAGLSGIQFFHGQFGGAWPGVDPQIICLSESWEKALRHTAEECRRLGLRFTMQNCPGWAMSGGPWIEPSNAMRHLVWSRTDITGGEQKNMDLPLPQPSGEEWRDYREIAVLAFPTPEGDTGEPLLPQTVRSNNATEWKELLSGKAAKPLKLPPAPEGEPHRVEVTFPSAVTLRTMEFSSINGFSHGWCYEPGVTVSAEAVMPDGSIKKLLYTDMHPSSWQDDRPVSLACPETDGAATYRISIANKHEMTLHSLRLFSAARKNNWESEAGWTLRSIERLGEQPEQSPAAFIHSNQIIDITASTDRQGYLQWNVPEGKWTVLRIGHVNAGQRNAPAPPEGTGWECDKLSEAGPSAHFAGYIGRLNSTVLAGGLLGGMLMDSWECKTQTWTNSMEAEFGDMAGYPLRRWLPAVFGYVVDDHETTARFLRDWRGVIGELFANRFYGRMAKLAGDNGLAITYETAAGDIFPADIMEYYKHADIPMCEFWQPVADNFVGSLNFKPIKPTASAARLYGKPRVAAEAFTSFALTWDEHLSMLKEVANINSVEGVTHLVFHTYTHNPRTDFLPPGTSFGSGIGTPFLRGQTWWKHMPEFTDYLSRCSYLLERGKPVSDVLWYLGDEINHKPDQNAPFPAGFKYDYCNPDVLLNRLSVSDGMLVTPEGISYRLLWMPDTRRMLPQTVEKLLTLVREGATVVGDAPHGLATLSGGEAAQQRFDDAVSALWGDAAQRIRNVGKGTVISGTTLDAALNELKLAPDVIGDGALWLHRRTEGADWYFVCAPHGSGFRGALDFRNNGNGVEIWDPVTGDITPVAATTNGSRTSVTFNLPQAGSCFVVFRRDRRQGKTPPALAIAGIDTEGAQSIPLVSPWTLAFPPGWDAPASLQLTELKAWKDLDLSPEANAFSGTATYTTTFTVDNFLKGTRYMLDLGRVEMIAAVSLNGKPLRTLWSPPYALDVSEAIQSGNNTLTVEVTGTWFNRLVHDAGQPEEKRKTWTIDGPRPGMELRESGLLGPVVLYAKSDASRSGKALREAFLHPGNQYKPMPFLHVNGRMTTSGIEERLRNAKQLSGFGGITVLPVSRGTRMNSNTVTPGTEPAYLSDGYFDRYGDILSISEKQGTGVILYDDIDFPSGSAGGRLQKEFPQYTRKFLVKEESLIKGPQSVRLARTDTTQLLMAVAAMDTSTLEVIDLSPFMKGNRLVWEAPAGNWRVMFFNCWLNIDALVDYMQPEAVDKVITMTYDEYAKRFSRYFGHVITKTFFDDVGFVYHEQLWTPAITEIFQRKYGKNPALYYPALFYDIGPETQAARVAFHDIRAELMAEGYVKKVAEWNAKYRLKSMGHPPENYSPNTVVANGDVLKFYRHTQIPLLDAIFYYGHGLHGFKQVSSAADRGDKPDVGAELYGAFPDDTTDSLMLYRVVMEVMARGVTFVVPHGMWYTTETDKIRIPPLISHENPLLGDLPRYSTYVGRSCTMLQGGARVSDIALLWPITAIQAESYINRDRHSGLPVAQWLPPHVCHQELSNLLTNELRRDFTFVHPEDLHNGKITAEGGELRLNNTENIQHYNVLLMPGGEVISAKTLKAIKHYYDGGGKIIATESLPAKSAEFGQDEEVVSLVKAIFGVSGAPGEDIQASNAQGGKAIYLKTADKASLDRAFDQLGLLPDVAFDTSRIQTGDLGYVNYIHKRKEGKEIYFFINSSDHPFTTEIRLRGSIKPELWNPHTGKIEKITEYEHRKENGEVYTRFDLSLPEVSSVFVVGKTTSGKLFGQ